MKPIKPKTRTRTNLRGEKVTIEKNNNLFDKVKKTTKKDGSQIIKTKAYRKNMYGPDGSKVLVKNKIYRSAINIGSPNKDTGNSLKLDPLTKEKIKQVGGLKRIYGRKIKKNETSRMDVNTGNFIVGVNKVKQKKNAFSKPKKDIYVDTRDAYSGDLLERKSIKSNRKTK